jgi:hypothetical protein
MDVHLAEAIKHLFAIQMFLDLNSILYSIQLNKGFCKLTSLKNQDFLDLTILYESLIDHLVCKLEDNGVIDTD